MSYKIQYAPEAAGRYPQVKKKPAIKWGRLAVLLLLFIGALWMRVHGVPDFLIPGDPEVTKAAASLMIEEIQNGAPVDDAVTVFCKEILNGAGF